MGAFLSARLVQNLARAGLDPASVPINDLLDPVASAAGAAAVALEDSLRVALAFAIRDIFFIAVAAAILALLATVLAPRHRLASSQQGPRTEP